ncbi:C40 family peptidase [Algoriphagus boritolerans]|uniref:C40 family peptidase n=1 Tax=Algoriphagus boritolerans TaxID=308111 RepID=UPI002FCDF638
MLIIGAIILAVNSFREIEIQPLAEFNDNSENSFKAKSSLRDSLDLFGKDLLGIPYSYAGTSREGFDCSGFIYYVFKNFDIDVPRSSSQYADFGKEVAIDQIQKGDILIFLSPTRDEIGHLGIVTNPNGMETEFIHASSGKEMKVIISSLKQPNYNRRFVKAISVIED